MKYKKILSLVLLFIILLTALLVNVILARSNKMPEVFSIELDGIYIDLSLINNKEKAESLREFIDSDDIAKFSNFINQKRNPIAQFYAFCGYMRSNQRKALKYLDSLLLSQAKVKVYIDDSDAKEESDLGYAILLLIKEFPEDLISRPEGSDYFNISEKVLLRAFQSKLTTNNQEYKKELIELISASSPKLSQVIFKQLFKQKDIRDMSLKEKIEISYVISSLDAEDKERFILSFLEEDNEYILVNTLSSIDKDSSKEIASILEKESFFKKRSSEVVRLAIEKYGLILKKDSLESISKFIKKQKKYDVVLAGIKQIKKYGDEEYYDFLKLYLELSYPEKINIAALDAIVTTTYKSNPDDVLRTMSFILRKIDKKDLALSAIRFHIDNSVQRNYGSVLYRLKQKENREMKEIAIEYIDHFGVTSGVSLLKELAADSDDEISQKAEKLLNGKFADYLQEEDSSEAEDDESKDSKDNKDRTGKKGKK